LDRIRERAHEIEALLEIIDRMTAPAGSSMREQAIQIERDLT